MINQTGTQRNNRNILPELNSDSIYSIYDDYSNGDLTDGNVDGTNPILGGARVMRHTQGEDVISNGILEVTNQDNISTKYNLYYSTASVLPSLMGWVFTYPAGLFMVGITDLSTGTDYGRPEEALLITPAQALQKRVSNSNSNLGLTFASVGQKVGWVCRLSTGPIMTWYQQVEGEAGYSLLTSYSVGASGSPFYMSCAWHSVSSTPFQIHKWRYVAKDYTSLGQLNTLFPL